MAKKNPQKKAQKAASTFGGYTGQAVSAINKRKAAVAAEMKKLGIK